MDASRRSVRRVLVLFALLALPGVLAACGGDDDSPRLANPTAATTTTTATGTTSPAVTTIAAVTTTAATTIAAVTTVAATAAPTTPPPTVAPVGSGLMRIWFLEDERLAPAYRRVETLAQALEELLAGPDAGEPATAIPDAVSLRGIELADGTATIDLSGSFASGGGSLSMMARIAQVVFTVTEHPDIERVRFALDGELVDTIGGEGIIVSRPQTRDDWAAAFAPFILISEPMPNALLDSPFLVQGSNSTFENHVDLRLVDDAGEPIVSTWTTGIGPIHDDDGTPMWGPFTASIAYPPGPARTATLQAIDASPETGRESVVFSVPVRLAENGGTSRLPGAGMEPVATPDGGSALLVDVRTGRHEGYDRVVFEFEGSLPGYSVGYVDGPLTEDPSDLPVDVLADGLLVVRMSWASGVDLSGDQPRETYLGPDRVSVGTPAVYGLVQFGDFEGVLNWVINTWTRPPFKVTTLTDPPRLVVDVATAA